MASNLEVVIMAAGKGTRMKSSLPKVLHPVAGKPMVCHVIDTARQLQARQTVVITGHGAEQVEAALTASYGSAGLQFARQMPQLGTGHAVQQAAPHLADEATVVVLSGDVPLTQADTLQALIAASGGDKLALLTIEFVDPTGYGRIVRDAAGQVQAIVEQKDASDEQRRIREVYSGIMAVPARLLKPWLAKLDNHNAQQEFYLTDVVKFAVADGVPVVAHVIADAAQVAGVNSPAQLAELERIHQRRRAEAFMSEGVRIIDPARFDVRGELVCAQDVQIDVNCIFEGRVELGQGVKIGANCVLANCRIEAGAVIHPFTHIDGEKLGVTVGEGALIGPFARLRPGAQLGAEVHIGNFVEVKNSTLAKGAKANHLAYLGDATVGERVNYGAGSITANYDGANKHRTVIEADVHIGSNCVLVAPVTIGAGGTVGGGSTITKSTEPGALSVARGKQISIANYKRPQKMK
ncbi:bifunctional UDP-N-acetylglucosamine diphosphorylase/glucosamine-1-phosphate N-acetyltransferase GlmU [Limnohabitans sp.]|uniref:bifunctional UDP-N-acetylglucosamine diphosphorylase/glucosamine-1-phosphate N-acetyltransferase GlmU n=1 Tax=Limnohabitans sp. TaxID=1907725 RepID=UPI00311EC770